MHPATAQLAGGRSSTTDDVAGKHASLVARLVSYASQRSQYAQHTDILSVCLREPRHHVRRLCRDNWRFLTRTERRRHLLQSPHVVRKIGNSIACETKTAFDSLLKADSRSRIIATFHFGEFTYGISYLMSGLAAKYPRYFLSLAPCRPATYTNMQRAIGPSVADRRSEIVLAETSMRDLSALLRQPKTNLVMFCDLPHEFGERIDVSFLQRQAAFPKGPATLALLNRVPIVPAICVQEAGGLTVHCGQQIEPPSAIGGDRTEAIRQLTQQLVDYFAFYFLKFPAQWRYLQRLPDYFVLSEPSQDGRCKT